MQKVFQAAFITVLGFVTAAGFAARAQADPIVAPNPGTPTVYTASTTTSYVYVDTPVTDRVDNYSTTLLALLNGNQVFSETFSVPFSDSTVQAAISQADSILSGDSASFGSPALISNSSVLQSSVTSPPPTYSYAGGPAPGQLVTNIISTTTGTFGRATVVTGTCQSEILYVYAGQMDTNIYTQYSVPRNVVTTDTYLDSQTYEIAGLFTSERAVAQRRPICIPLPQPGRVAVGRIPASGETDIQES